MTITFFSFHEAIIYMATIGLKAPFPYFGGKLRIAKEVWARFGDVPNFR